MKEGKNDMIIEILSEDKSGSYVVSREVKQICGKAGVKTEINVRPHRGCGSFPKDMDAKPAKFASPQRLRGTSKGT